MTPRFPCLNIQGKEQLRGLHAEAWLATQELPAVVKTSAPSDETPAED